MESESRKRKAQRKADADAKLESNVKKDREAGYSYAAIASRYGIAESTARRIALRES